MTVVVGFSEVDTTGRALPVHDTQFFILCVIVLGPSTAAWIVVLTFIIYKQNISILPTWKISFHPSILLVDVLLLLPIDLFLSKFLPTPARGPIDEALWASSAFL